MKKKDIILAGLVVVILGAVGYVLFSPSGQKPAPEVTLQTLDGTKVSLSELRGRPVLVNFWATTCPGCVKEMPHLAELYEELSPQGLEIIGIAMYYDPPNQVAALSEARQIPYTIALDIDGAAAQAFGNVRLTPTSYLMSPEGRIVQQKIGELDMQHVERVIRNMLKQTQQARLDTHALG
ncbi:MAG: TlpA family protein disulfide reductase [Gammaproteobacteria bacterium]|nr:TlpA family protein disulfide reductase [Gammaproteobacteria bacterium]